MNLLSFFKKEQRYQMCCMPLRVISRLTDFVEPFHISMTQNKCQIPRHKSGGGTSAGLLTYNWKLWVELAFLWFITPPLWDPTERTQAACWIGCTIKSKHLQVLGGWVQDVRRRHTCEAIHHLILIAAPFVSHRGVNRHVHTYIMYRLIRHTLIMVCLCDQIQD